MAGQLVVVGEEFEGVSLNITRNSSSGSVIPNGSKTEMSMALERFATDFFTDFCLKRSVFGCCVLVGVLSKLLI